MDECPCVHQSSQPYRPSLNITLKLTMRKSVVAGALIGFNKRSEKALKFVQGCTGKSDLHNKSCNINIKSNKARSVPQVGQFGQPMPGNHQFGPQSPAQAAIQPHDNFWVMILISGQV
ncbi:hypothetical protein BLOT_000571 [Blomia tropicalis]|nr:hypothetical protein BLOT_000571 [Blomia tropicalis]